MYLIYEISSRFYHINLENSFFKTGFFIYILAPIQVPNYMLGQINILFLTFVLMSVYFFENSRFQLNNIRQNNLWGGLMIGFAITFKPIAILFVPFLIDLTINFHGSQKFQFGWRITVQRFCGIGAILLPNLFVFWRYPNLFNDFITVNFQNTLDYHQSTSVTRLISEILFTFNITVPKSTLILVITSIFFLPVYYRYLSLPKSRTSFAASFDFAILIVLLAYPDSWFLYLIFHLALFLPAMGELENSFQKNQFQKIRTVTVYLTKWLEVYFFIGVICHYVLFGFDPITPILLLIIFITFFYLHGHSKKIVESEIIN